MSTVKKTIIKHTYTPPKQLRKPVFYALKLYRQGHMHLTDAIDVSVRSFTSNPKDPDYISPKTLTHNAVRKHLLKVVASD